MKSSLLNGWAKAQPGSIPVPKFDAACIQLCASRGAATKVKIACSVEVT